MQDKSSVQFSIADDQQLTQPMLVIGFSSEEAVQFQELVVDEKFKVYPFDSYSDVEVIQDHIPSIVLMNGRCEKSIADHIRHIRKIFDMPMLPVIIVSNDYDELTVSMCLGLGSVDFLSRPIEGIPLRVRIHSLMYMAESQLAINSQAQELDYYHDMEQREQDIAKSIFNTVLRKENLELEGIRYQLSSMSVFNGDLLLAAKAPQGNLHLFVGDFTGHGLSASIGSLPTSEIFYAMTAKGFEPVDIVSEINRRLKQLLPVGIFLASCFVEVSATGETASFWVGGIPDVMILRAENHEVVKLRSRHLPMGVLPHTQFNTAMDVIALEPDDRIFLMTDGVIETQTPEGELFGDVRLDGVFARAKTTDQVFDDILTALDDFRAGEKQSDDVTLLEYCGADVHDAETVIEDLPAVGDGASVDWEMRMNMKPEVLRSFDPRPLLTQLLVEVQGLNEHRERLYLVIAELFSNALEHGVLGLSSELKSSPEGFAQYYLEREQSLENLSEGFVQFHLVHTPTQDGGQLSIDVKDTGKGFDYEAVNNEKCLSSKDSFCGRGVPLMRKICSSIEYFRPGNHVRVTYDWVKA